MTRAHRVLTMYYYCTIKLKTKERVCVRERERSYYKRDNDEVVISESGLAGDSCTKCSGNNDPDRNVNANANANNDDNDDDDNNNNSG